MKNSRKFQILLPLALVAQPTLSHAAELYWDGSGTVWSANTAWSTDPTAASPDPDAMPTGTDVAKFSIAGIATAQTIGLDADQTVQGLVVSSAGGTIIQGSGANRVLTIGSDGIVVNTGAGALTLGSATAAQGVTVTLGASQSWTNGATGTIVVNNGVTGVDTNLSISGGLTTRQATGVAINLGTGTFTMSGSFYEMGSQANTMGNSTLLSGNVFVRNGASLGTTGTLTLGAPTGTASANLRVGSTTFARPVALAAGGNLLIDSLGASGATFTGGVTGTNNLTLASSSTGTLNVNTATVNHTGTLVLSNANGNGTLNLNSVIGANVTTVNARLSAATGVIVLNNAGNAWTGDTTIEANARVRLLVSNVIPNGATAGNLILNGTLDMRGAAETVNGLSGTGTITRGTTGTATLTVGANNVSSTFSGLIQNGTGTLALTKTGTGTLTLDTANTYSGTTTIGASSGVVAISNGAAFGTGTVAITKNTTTTGTLELSNGITLANNFTFSSATGFGIGGGSAHIRNVSGNNTLNGTLTLNATGGNGINVESNGGLLTLGGTITSTVADNTRQLGLSGTGDGLVTGNIVDTGVNKFTVIKSGTGTWTLSGTNAYTGATNVNTGTLTLTQNGGLADTASVNVGADGILHLTFEGSDTVGSLVLGGVAQGPGTYDAANSGGRITGSGSLIVPVTDPFTPWVNGFTFEANADKAKTGDPDGDGQSNLLEFALNGDPTSGAVSGKVVTKIDADHLTLTLPVRTGAVFSGTGPVLSAAIGDVIYRIEGDDDLNGFAAGVEETTTLSEGLPTLGTGWTYRTFRLTSTVSATPKGFLRAHANDAP